MKILHLYSDRRLTGPADPVIELCRDLKDRGHEVILAYRAPDPAEAKRNDDTLRLERSIMAAGVAGTTRLALNRYLHPVDTLRDLIELRRLLREDRVDVVHAHLSHDHLLAAACTGAGRRDGVGGRRRTPVVRSLYRRTVLPATLGQKLLLERMSDGLVVFTPGFRRAYAERFRVDPDRIAVAPPSLALDRYRPDASYRDMRAELEIPRDAVTIGIVGRFQKYRRMDLFFQAARKVVAEDPSVRFVVIGRSGQYFETVVKPRQDHGLKEHVVLAGYRREDYVDTLAALDVSTLLMPGSDGTARAIREAMAMGKPCVVSDVGMLPELVPHDTAGLVVPLDADRLAEAWLRLIREPQLRERLGRGARSVAEANARSDRTVEAVEHLYERLMQRDR